MGPRVHLNPDFISVFDNAFLTPNEQANTKAKLNQIHP